jgi:hypothetical protein
MAWQYGQMNRIDVELVALSLLAAFLAGFALSHDYQLFGAGFVAMCAVTTIAAIRRRL